MERVTLDFSLPNFVTIGLVAGFWFLVIIGGWSVYKASSGSAASAG